MSDDDFTALAAKVANARANVAAFGYAFSTMNASETAGLAMAEARSSELSWLLKKAAEARVKAEMEVA